MTDIERMDRCANASTVLTRSEYDSQGHNAVISWHVARSRAADDGLCPMPEQEDAYSLDPVRRMRARFTDLRILEAEMRALRVTA
jgi:hypothetical protein